MSSSLLCSRCMEKALKNGKEDLRPAYFLYKGFSLCIDCFKNDILINNVTKRKKK